MIETVILKRIRNSPIRLVRRVTERRPRQYYQLVVMSVQSGSVMVHGAKNGCWGPKSWS
jgi:hypothetical protein